MTRFWSDDEDARLLTALAAGESIATVGAALSRTTIACRRRAYMLNKPALTCIDRCGATVGKRSTSGRCRPCATRRANADPVLNAKRSATMLRTLSDPDKRAAHAAASASRLAAWRETPEGRAAQKRTARAANRASARRTAWLPDDRREEHWRLRKAFGAAESKRMILASMTPFERKLARVREGAQLVAAFAPRRADPVFTLGGVAPEAM